MFLPHHTGASIDTYQMSKIIWLIGPKNAVNFYFNKNVFFIQGLVGN